jgi:two-component system sensor histidine kinase/response regulator
MDDSTLNDTAPDIMIIDDSIDNLSLLTRILHRRGYQVRTFTNGPSALAAACTQPPDLILLDIMMPEMDGFMVCERLKSADITCQVPVIFLSALSQTEDKLRAFQAGGVDYITKPFHHEEVLVRVENHLHLQSLHHQLQQTNQVLQESNAALKMRNEELDAFAQTVAHDLKNPLGNVLGYASLLAEHYPQLSDADRSNAVECITRASQNMMGIIDGLLLLARVGSAEVKYTPLNMGLIVRQALERLAQPLKEAGAQVTLPENWPAAIGYAPWVEEVWINYLSNGLKYGGQLPALTLGGESQPGGMARFWVGDNGEGLSAEQQSQLFIPFTRLQAGKASGHGLGLSIVRRIIEKLGGEVGVDSQPDEGSRFYFTLPQIQL